MNLVKSALLGSALLAATMATPASAVVYQYQLTGLDMASWELESMPTPDLVEPTLFAIFGVDVTVNGTLGAYTLAFFTDSAVPLAGGLGFNPPLPNAVQLPGEQLFTGPTGSPTMKTGVFSLSAVGFDTEGNIILVPDAYTLTVTGPAAVPEPASWALMIAGFGLAGGAIRAGARKRSLG